jgi:AAA15 family ATPase/GTPase
MLKNIRINSFRNLTDLILQDVGQINILLGENNSGKTSLLETLQMFKEVSPIRSLLRISRRRENIYALPMRYSLSYYDCFINSFNIKQDICKYIDIQAETDNHEEYHLTIRGEELKELIISEKYRHDKLRYHFGNEIPDEIRVFKGWCEYKYGSEVFVDSFELPEIEMNPQIMRSGRETIVNVNYISPFDHYISASSITLNKIIRAGHKESIIELLEKFDQNISGFEVIGERGKPIAYIKQKNAGLLPLSVYGDGLKKILTIVAGLLSSKNGILLIDEIETAIHKKALTDVFKWLVEASKSLNVQIFLTTHSIEAVDALLECSSEYLSDIVCYRLENYEEKLYATRYSGEKLNKIRNYQGLDVR